MEWTNKFTHRVWDAAIEIASLSSSRIVLAKPFAVAAAADQQSFAFHSNEGLFGCNCSIRPEEEPFVSLLDTKVL